MKANAILIATGLVFATTTLAPAHHGWLWAEDQQFELTGVIREVKLGNPHGMLTVDSGGELWTVEVGQPWRNQRAGLDDEKLTPGVTLTASGHRSSDPTQKLMKAEQIVIGGTVHDLYPDRD